MLRSFYIAGTGMMTQRAKMDVVINNITNGDTVGYKNDKVITRSFQDMLLERLHDPNFISRRQVGPQNTGLYVDELVTNFAQGSPQTTNIATDMMINGEGFFTIQTPEGIQYTRAGNFATNAAGDLLTQDGNYVLGQGGGRINLGPGGPARMVVNPDGTITVDGVQRARLQIVEFEDTNVLRKMGNNNFVPYNNAAPRQAQNSSVQQGAIEGSNVEMGQEVTEMLMTNRVYESSQRILRMTDESLSRTVNDIAKF